MRFFGPAWNWKRIELQDKEKQDFFSQKNNFIILIKLLSCTYIRIHGTILNRSGNNLWFYFLQKRNLLSTKKELFPPPSNPGPRSVEKIPKPQVGGTINYIKK